ncbi:MAG: OprO/OprP family phosphate-selective porin [Deltaproteobacteria bacterium]|nr:OprO/OprP family phosphate-selective porin [Deltaproteobacteria bacterium]
MASSSPLRLILVAAGLALTATAVSAQPARRGATPPPPPVPDPAIAELKTRLDAEEAARKAAEERLAAAEQNLAAQAAAAKTAADAVAAQQAKLDALSTQLAAEATARTAAITAASDAITRTAPPSIGARWGGVSLSGFAQIDLAIRQSSSDQLVDATSEPLNQDRFNLRRARLKVNADYGRVLGALELDANTNNGSQARVVGAEASYSFAKRERGATSPAIATIGSFKIPFGQEVLESDADRLFLERSTVARALFPGEFDLGARVAGSWRSFSYSLAAQNGEPIGEKGFPLRDPNAAKDYTGHVGIDTTFGKLRIVAGLSALTGTGFHKGSPATKDQLVWRDTNENGVVELSEIQNIPGHAATAATNFDRFAVGGDLRLVLPIAKVGKLELRGEITTGNNLDRAIVPADPVSSGRDLRELGYYVQLLQELPHGFILGARFDHYDPDADATDRQSGEVVPSVATFSSLALAAAARIQNGRLIVEYDVNRNHQGRDAAGVPTNLKDNAFLVRAEVKF